MGESITLQPLYHRIPSPTEYRGEDVEVVVQRKTNDQGVFQGNFTKRGAVTGVRVSPCPWHVPGKGHT